MTLEEVKQQWANTKKSITRMKIQIESNEKGEGKTLSSAEMKCRLGILESYFKQILTYQAQTEKYDSEDNARNRGFVHLTQNIQSQLGEYVHNTTLSESTICFPAHSHKLPQSKLSTFTTVVTLEGNRFMVGPTIQSELYKILLRLRLHRFALTADIVKIYRQVLIDSQNIKFQYILWRNSEEEEIRTYHLWNVADQYMDQFKLGAKTIKSSFYDDDFLCGSDTLKELSRMKQEVNEILIRGSFQLDKWHSNHRDFQDEKTVKDLNIEDSIVTALLASLGTNKKMFSYFRFRLKSKLMNKSYKRTILSVSSALFDPLGLLSPLIIKAKIIMQELWIPKIGWDESVPQEIHSAWKTFVSDLKLLPSLKIPRFCLAPDYKSVLLHGFCDSSIQLW
ncbi:hypothetical protein CVS40_12796 [Lucilia cuprina]|nr:hypothetical protein CVS40_12796 [Lucilia cuprina]